MGKRRTTLLEADRLRDGCLGTLRALGQNVNARLISREEGRCTLQLKLGLNAPWLSFEVGTTRTHLSYPLAAGFIVQATRAAASWLLFAPYVSGAMGQHLVSEHVSYVDAVGNCHIETGERLVAHVEGKKAARGAGCRIRGVTSDQLLFALLAQPSLVTAPARKLALAAGIGKSAALEQLGRLNAQGLLDYYPTAGLLRGRELLDRWLQAYAEAVRSSWLFARCRTEVADPRALEVVIERVCRNRESEGASREPWRWAYGGAAAAHRMLAFGRGAETLIHLSRVPVDLLEQLRAVRAPDGALTILHTPGELAYQGAKLHLAHPLLIYSELLISDEPRATRAANAIREQFLAEVA
jgi:hypothetical protein